MLKQVGHSPSLEVSTHHTQPSLSHPPQVEARCFFTIETMEIHTRRRSQKMWLLLATLNLSQMPRRQTQLYSQNAKKHYTMVSLDHTISHSTPFTTRSFKQNLKRRPQQPLHMGTQKFHISWESYTLASQFIQFPNFPISNLSNFQYPTLIQHLYTQNARSLQNG